MNKPRIFYKKILDILTVDGKVLVGDLPNVNRKYRFLKSSFGKNNATIVETINLNTLNIPTIPRYGEKLKWFLEQVKKRTEKEFNKINLPEEIKNKLAHLKFNPYSSDWALDITDKYLFYRLLMTYDTNKNKKYSICSSYQIK